MDSDVLWALVLTAALVAGVLADLATPKSYVEEALPATPHKPAKDVVQVLAYNCSGRYYYKLEGEPAFLAFAGLAQRQYVNVNGSVIVVTEPRYLLVPSDRPGFTHVSTSPVWEFEGEKAKYVVYAVVPCPNSR